MPQQAYSHFYESFIFIVKALEVTAYDLHKNKISDIFKDDWDASSKARHHTYSMQKQPSRSVLRKRCSENMQQNYRRAPMPKCEFNKVASQIY